MSVLWKQVPLLRIALGSRAPGGLAHACLSPCSPHPGLRAHARNPRSSLGSQLHSCWGHPAQRGSPHPARVAGWYREPVWLSRCQPRSPACRPYSSPSHMQEAQSRLCRVRPHGRFSARPAGKLWEWRQIRRTPDAGTCHSGRPIPLPINTSALRIRPRPTVSHAQAQASFLRLCLQNKELCLLACCAAFRGKTQKVLCV